MILPMRMGLAALPFVLSCAAAGPTTIGQSAPVLGGLGCPEGATMDRAGMCHCASDRVLLAGACMPAARARLACGRRGAVLDHRMGGPSTCTLLACAAGELPDEMTGACLGAGALRAIAAKRGVSVTESETVGCLANGRLRVAWGLPFCAVAEDPCGPAEIKSGTRCAPEPACGAGYVLEPGTQRCLRLTTPGRDTPTFDVATWARCSLGADGAEGAHALCAMISRDANGFEGQPMTKWRLHVDLHFPDNEVSAAQLRLEVLPAEQRGGERAPAWLAGSAARAGEGLVEELRALGGTASAARVDLDVWCSVRHGAPPVALPLDQTATRTPSAGTMP